MLRYVYEHSNAVSQALANHKRQSEMADAFFGTWFIHVNQALRFIFRRCTIF
jgi:hypothetical protein